MRFLTNSRLTAKVTKLEEKIEALKDERDELEETNFRLRTELRDVKHQKKVEEEDIKHMVRLKQEKLDVAHEKRGMEQERQREKEVAKVKDTYRDKLEGNLEERIKEIREMYTEILACLPNVNVRLKGET